MPTALSNEQILKAHHNDELFFGRKMRKKANTKVKYLQTHHPWG